MEKKKNKEHGDGGMEEQGRGRAWGGEGMKEDSL